MPVASGPLVHCLTNAVTAGFVADCVAAVGGRPVMAEDPRECAQLADVADALLINLGQLDPRKEAAIWAAVGARGPRPWTLDPVAVGVFPSRLAFAQRLFAAHPPRQIRGNASEVWALATGHASGSGTESTKQTLEPPETWIGPLRHVPEICLTQAGQAPGKRDLCLAGERETWHPGGVPIMGQLPGFGCALSAVAATLQSGDQALDLFGAAGRAAAHAGVGAFRAAFVSALACASRAVRARAALPFYFVAGPQDCGGSHARLSQVLAAALAGGITAYQYRPKAMGPEAALAAGRTLRAQCAAAGVAFLVNDDLDLALALDADGLHLGQGDGDPQAARAALGGQAILGLSISTAEHWASYQGDCVDYVGLGPYAATATKPDHGAPLGRAGLRRLRAQNPGVPAVAIGGLGPQNMREALTAGVDGVAVVSALTAAARPAEQAQSLAALIEAARSGDSERREP